MNLQSSARGKSLQRVKASFKALSIALILLLLASCSTTNSESKRIDEAIKKSEEEKKLQDDNRNTQIDSLKRKEQADIAAQENKLRMSFCSQRQLLYTKLVQPQGSIIETNCIYELVGNPLTVLQAVNQGILVTFNQFAGPDVAHIVFYLKTTKAYSNNASIQNMLVESIGTFKYKTFFGQEKTVYAFKHLKDH